MIVSSMIANQTTPSNNEIGGSDKETVETITITTTMTHPIQRSSNIFIEPSSTILLTASQQPIATETTTSETIIHIREAFLNIIK